MKYPYAVKANGKWYQPNEDVPTEPEKEPVDESANQIDVSPVKDVQAELPVEDASRKRGRHQRR